ncbi:MAG TPA: adenylosuccinate synthase [Armatimonadetes bacterium]|nr:adenylosuccinate synthase [Armatimonadota bacterium]
MAVTAVVGAQWGDEGKGRVVDLLAQQADVVARFQGGSNAGHTVINDYGKFALHLVPSGIFNPGAWCLLAPGVAVHPGDLLAEMDTLTAAGVRLDQLRISERAHVVMPYHQLLDGLDEARRSQDGSAIGTTKKGIGPCYTDKVSRVGLQVGDLLDRDWLAGFIARAVAEKNLVITRIYESDPLDAEEVFETVWAQGQRLAPHIGDTCEIIEAALAADQAILLEGQLGAMRDLDWGIYPYVTSSSPTAGGAAAGAGIPPAYITRVVGVAKAYSSAVGAGPFPTELHGAEAEQLREIGGEYGATTGRPRRCGWFDALSVRHSARLSGFTEIALTKLDVLDSYAEIPICVGYELDGVRLDRMPMTRLIDRVTPIYETLPGWQSPTVDCRTWADLPATAQAYVLRLEELCGVHISQVSVGPERASMVER